MTNTKNEPGTIDPDKLVSAKVEPATVLPPELLGKVTVKQPAKPATKKWTLLRVVLIILAILGGLSLIIAGVVLIAQNAPKP
jgi:hypothetical protein